MNIVPIAHHFYRVAVQFHLDSAWSNMIPVVDLAPGYDKVWETHGRREFLAGQPAFAARR